MPGCVMKDKENEMIECNGYDGVAVEFIDLNAIRSLPHYGDRAPVVVRPLRIEEGK